MNTSWDLVRSFLGVLEHGSLSGAARALGLTQPTLARHIAQLESDLGRSLFTRSPQGLSPTADAERLKPYGEAMAAAAEAMVRAASGDEKTLSGVVRIAASDVIGTEVLPEILRGLTMAHPNLAVELVLSNSSADLLRRDADIAVRMIRPTQKALIARRAGLIRLGLFAHRDYLALRGMPKRIEDLHEHAVIGFDRDPSGPAILDAIGGGLRRDMFTYRIDNQIAQIAAIRAACGPGIVQVKLAERSGLVRLFQDEINLSLEAWITMHEDLRNDPRMRLAFDHLYEGMSRHVVQ
ncbi:LysR family transcriptional regulator [Jannaschia formosa]|uniref:LysR substrate-binding domain-containing protein n=1 Tax=Jannaschia formosa TaxID=2259592 RepID=UPI000E1C3051|nr:LysR family transcriptional regulator [Jannaschia formosa]TFL15945.1 LysR family transcriptional regulator [Jannaschia formosa]